MSQGKQINYSFTFFLSKKIVLTPSQSIFILFISAFNTELLAFFIAKIKPPLPAPHNFNPSKFFFLKNRIFFSICILEIFFSKFFFIDQLSFNLPIKKFTFILFRFLITLLDISFIKFNCFIFLVIVCFCLVKISSAFLFFLVS